MLVISLLPFSCGNHEKELAEDTRPTIKVKISKPELISDAEQIVVSGTIQAGEDADVSTRMMGYLVGLNIKVGEEVRKGQVLASVSNEALQAQKGQVNAKIKESEVALKNVEKNYKRIKSLHEKQSVTQKELDDITARYEMAKTRVEQARASLNEVQANIGYTTLTAPISGVVTEKFLSSGDLATPGRPILSIESLKDFQAVVNIPESQITKVKEGDQVKVLIKSTQRQLSGILSELSLSAQSTGGQYVAKIDLHEEEKAATALYSGMFVNAFFQPGSQEAATQDAGPLTVHKEAIYRQGQLTGLFFPTHNNVAILRWVRLGKEYGNKVEVLSGLKPDESYISSWDGKLINGAKLAIQ